MYSIFKDKPSDDKKWIICIDSYINEIDTFNPTKDEINKIKRNYTKFYLAIDYNGSFYFTDNINEAIYFKEKEYAEYWYYEYFLWKHPYVSKIPVHFILK